MYNQLFLMRWESRQCALFYSHVEETKKIADAMKQQILLSQT